MIASRLAEKCPNAPLLEGFSLAPFAVDTFHLSHFGSPPAITELFLAPLLKVYPSPMTSCSLQFI